MELQVHSIHFDADIKLINFIHQKVNKLTVFYDEIIGSEVFLRLDKAQDSANKIAEIKILTRGKKLFAKKQCKTFEEAADLAVEAIRRQVRRKKGKELEMH